MKEEEKQGGKIQIRINPGGRTLAEALRVPPGRQEELINIGGKAFTLNEGDIAGAMEAISSMCNTLEEFAFMCYGLGFKEAISTKKGEEVSDWLVKKLKTQLTEEEKEAVRGLDMPMFIPKAVQTKGRKLREKLGISPERANELQELCVDAVVRLADEKAGVVEALQAAGAMCATLNEYTFVVYCMGWDQSKIKRLRNGETDESRSE